MKIVTAFDSFKGSMTSLEAGKAAAEGFHRADPEAEVIVRPLADGGEGTVEALTAGMGGMIEKAEVTGPLGTPVRCTYGIIASRSNGQTPAEEKTAVIEMSGAAGITLVPAEQRNPLVTTTYGVGEVIRDAIARGCRRFIIGIGGSATNDGGIGMLQALGWEFFTKDGKTVSRGAKGLSELDHIEDHHVLPALRQCTFRIACDVTNPLSGPEGCSVVFGPQKGATPEMVSEMDRWMVRYAEIVQTKCPEADPAAPGSGAAGGLGFAFRTFLHGTLESGFQIVSEETHLASFLRQADLVVTGEGRLDGQTAMGKGPAGVARLAKKYGKPVIALAGSVTADAKKCNQSGVDAFFPIVRGVTTLEDAMDLAVARHNLADTAEQVLRLFRIANFSTF